MPTPGYLYRMLSVEPINLHSSDLFDPGDICPGVLSARLLHSTDEAQPNCLTVYELSDIGSVLSDAKYFEADRMRTSKFATALEWHIFTLVSRKPEEVGFMPLSSVVATFFISPRPDMVEEFHEWHEKEHGPMLFDVPGFQSIDRLQLASCYGGGDGRGLMLGQTCYDAVNELGGEVWKKSLTPWTMKIRESVSKPGWRKVWTVVKLLQVDDHLTRN